MCDSVGTLKMNETGLKRQRFRINFNFILLLNSYSHTAGGGYSTQFNESPNLGKRIFFEYITSILFVFYVQLF